MNEKLHKTESFSEVSQELVVNNLLTGGQERLIYRREQKKKNRQALIPLSLCTLSEVRKEAWAKLRERRREREREISASVKLVKGGCGGKDGKERDWSKRDDSVGKDSEMSAEGTPILGYEAHHKPAARRVILS